MKTQFLTFVQNIANNVFTKSYVVVKIAVKGIYRRVLVAKDNLKEAIEKAMEWAKEKGLKIRVMGTYKAQKDYYVTSFFDGADFQKSEQIVLIGKMQGDAFHANDILMKCPSKYNDGKPQVNS